MWNSLALALQTLTALPPLADGTPTRDAARRAVMLFPLVGALLGVAASLAWLLGSRLWPGQPLVSAALALAAGAALTGGRGLGGLARGADGLAAHGGGGDRARAFAVMRDPRRGTAGLAALAVTVALRLAFLSALPPERAWTILLLAGALGGWAVAFGYSAFPVASAPGGGEEATGPGIGAAGGSEFLAATVLAVIAGALWPPRALPAFAGAALAAGLGAWQFNRRIGGLNRPLCAALGEIAEIAALACLTIRT